jgi:hypothetical protein
VGYGKPPRRTRFRKGQSGNPGGRARGVTAGRAKTLALKEAYRMVRVKVGEGIVFLPAIQAILRGQVALAAKGNGADPEEREAITSLVRRATAHCAWSPNPGPQAQAFACEADELFYGGQAGGGKTDLGLGLALAAHKRSLILRRINKDAVKLVERVAQILGHRGGYNGQLQRWKLGDALIEFAGCEHEDDKHRFKGDPHDLIYFDEGTDFLQSQYRFVIGWNRSADPHQRCRIVVGSNPPTTSEGL